MHIVSGHPQHRGGDSFDNCTVRYELVVLLPNTVLKSAFNLNDKHMFSVSHDCKNS